MYISDLEQQLKDYKEKLNPTTLQLFYPNGESQIDNLSRNVAMFVKSNQDLAQLLEIYHVTKYTLIYHNALFPYATYAQLIKKYGKDIDRFDYILMLAYARLGHAGTFKVLSDDELNSIYKDAFELIRKFEIIEANTQGDEMLDAYGEFGYDKTNPIPVYGYHGTGDYFDRLRTTGGEKVEIERTGSFSAKNIKGIIDGYYVSWKPNEMRVLYMCIYNTKTSEKAPEGFTLAF